MQLASLAMLNETFSVIFKHCVGIGSDIFISLLMLQSIWMSKSMMREKVGQGYAHLQYRMMLSSTLISLCIADASSFIERERIVPSQLLPILLPPVHCYSSHFPVKKKSLHFFPSNKNTTDSACKLHSDPSKARLHLNQRKEMVF